MDSEQEVLGRGEQEVDMNWIHQREKKYPRNRHHYKTGKRQNYANMRRWRGGGAGGVQHREKQKHLLHVH